VSRVRAVSTALVAAAVVVATTRAQEVGGATVVPIQVTGDPMSRFSMVVLGDGYTAEELPRFRAHLDRHLNVLWSIEPFRSYRSYINVYAVEIVSGQSGISCDPEVRQQKTTPLQMRFDNGCANPTARGILVDNDAAQAYAARATPHYDQILVIANTDTYGGIGGTVATTSGGNALGPLITPHEIGHSLGQLQDEYTYSARGKPGGPYTGGEPRSPHLTLLTEEEMRVRQAKWWRWLGEISESGGRIARFEGGASRTSGVWRPSKHSMMISVGYYFDQVSRERMTQRIAEQVALIAGSTPTDAPVGARDVLWIATAHPVYHDLEITWRVDGQLAAAAANSRFLDLGALNLPARSTVAVTVVDPTPFVRDPEIRAKALTATRTWVVAEGEAPRPPPVRFTAATPTDRPAGGRDVVYVDIAAPGDRLPSIAWALNGSAVADPTAGSTFPLARHQLPIGTHRLTATVTDPRDSGPPLLTREWVIDNTGPTVGYTLAHAIASSTAADDEAPHHVVRDEFTMTLAATDDQPGYVVVEFRVNGDGWHHYYGWPDAPPGTPFRFTPRGTVIKELVYGSLSVEGLSPQPWELRQPGWGTHRIEYRGIDAAGNIGDAKAFRVTILPSRPCTKTITTPYEGPLRIDAGTVCLDGATVSGGVQVDPGASLIALKTRVDGPLTASAAAVIELIDTSVDRLSVDGTTESLMLFGTTVAGETAILRNATPRPGLIAASTFRGAVSCTGSLTNGGGNLFVVRSVGLAGC
jgi:hypothetical protein